MTHLEAFNLVDQVCKLYRGTRQEHELLVQALAVLKLEQPKETPQKEK